MSNVLETLRATAEKPLVKMAVVGSIGVAALTGCTAEAAPHATAASHSAVVEGGNTNGLTDAENIEIVTDCSEVFANDAGAADALQDADPTQAETMLKMARDGNACDTIAEYLHEDEK